MTDKITIHIDEYKELKEAYVILQALYAGGVDNWEWYDASLESLEQEDE